MDPLNPERIISDHGKEFDNILVRQFCKATKIQIHYTSKNYSNSLGTLNKCHATLNEIMRININQNKNTNKRSNSH
ncbi:hypothetical protein, partial [Klebsiella pneumoniae]|uniref:hypothetical protein n=1 Tax=Klebsiella pneumoniae TaxID=573 RepID=UPI0040558EB4